MKKLQEKMADVQKLNEQKTKEKEKEIVLEIEKKMDGREPKEKSSKKDKKGEKILTNEKEVQGKNKKDNEMNMKKDKKKSKNVDTKTSASARSDVECSVGCVGEWSLLEEEGGISLYTGKPGIECGVVVDASSYFDRYVYVDDMCVGWTVDIIPYTVLHVALILLCSFDRFFRFCLTLSHFLFFVLIYTVLLSSSLSLLLLFFISSLHRTALHCTLLNCCALHCTLLFIFELHILLTTWSSFPL